ncbi:hypothetical protein ERJ75_001481900 [Trypanosoma vivax]|nr:hypothetical protein ERJ75_001481900 [Trypanosoma vivax]
MWADGRHAMQRAHIESEATLRTALPAASHWRAPHRSKARPLLFAEHCASSHGAGLVEDVRAAKNTTLCVTRVRRCVGYVLLAHVQCGAARTRPQSSRFTATHYKHGDREFRLALALLGLTSSKRTQRTHTHALGGAWSRQDACLGAAWHGVRSCLQAARNTSIASSASGSEASGAECTAAPGDGPHQCSSTSQSHHTQPRSQRAATHPATRAASRARLPRTAWVPTQRPPESRTRQSKLVERLTGPHHRTGAAPLPTFSTTAPVHTTKEMERSAMLARPHTARPCSTAGRVRRHTPSWGKRQHTHTHTQTLKQTGSKSKVCAGQNGSASR